MKVRGIILPAREKLIGNITIYVDPFGDDFNDGASPLSAFKTIQRAYEQIAGAEIKGGAVTIELAFGDYPSPLIFPNLKTDVLITGQGESTRVRSTTGGNDDTYHFDRSHSKMAREE